MELKFKAFDKIDKRMIDVFSFCNEFIKEKQGIFTAKFKRSDYAELRQFTGFLIEGKEVYNGWILRDEYKKYLVDFRNGSFVVVHEPSCGSEREGECKIDYLFDFLKLKKDNIEIIGNIDENPNLLQ